MRHTDPWGIDASFTDGQEKEHTVSAETRRKLLAALGAEGKESPEEPGLFVLREGETLPGVLAGEIEFEDGSRRPVSWAGKLPLGYHWVVASGGEKTRLIVTPAKCFLDASQRIWGWALQLYSLRSKDSWGMGDFGDLREFTRWSGAKLGSRVIMTNPLNANAPGTPQQSSPYSPQRALPAHRRY